MSPRFDTILLARAAGRLGTQLCRGIAQLTPRLRVSEIANLRPNEKAAICDLADADAVLTRGNVRSFDNEAYEAFQRLWKRYGVQELETLKEELLAPLSAGQFGSPRDLPPPLDRAGRAVMRVALPQWQQIRSSVE
jgi:hypothetical protein